MREYDEIVKELDSKIPRDAVSLRDGGGGRKLSYLEGHYVIDRLNKVIGVGNWAYGSEVQLVQKDEENNSVHYIAKVRLVVTIGTTTTEFADYGYGDGKDRNTIGKAHELAVKEAVTDGLKRCAKNLGMSMGLALYDKEQVNVDDGKTQEKSQPRKDAIKAPMDEKKQEAARTNVGKSRADINRLAQTTAKVAIEKQIKTMEQLKEIIRSKGASKLEELSDAKASEFLEELREMVNK